MPMDMPMVMRAAGTIVTSTIVKLYTSGSNKVEACGANGAAFGVAQEGGRLAPIPTVVTDPPQAALVNENLNVYTTGQVCLLRAGDVITAGAKIKADSSGYGVACAETTGLKENYVGTALTGAASGELFDILVQPGVVTTP